MLFCSNRKTSARCLPAPCCFDKLRNVIVLIHIMLCSLKSRCSAVPDAYCSADNGLLAAAQAVRSGTFTRVACNHSELKKLLSFHHSPGSDTCSLEMPASGNKNVMLIIGRTAQRFGLLPAEFEACIKVSTPLPGRRTYQVSPDKAGMLNNWLCV